MQGLPVILIWHNLKSLNKALDIFIEFEFCESDFYFLNGIKNCMVATYNFGSVYTPIFSRRYHGNHSSWISLSSGFHMTLYLLLHMTSFSEMPYEHSILLRVFQIYSGTTPFAL